MLNLFNILLVILQSSMTIAVFIGLPVLLIMRIIMIIKDNKGLKSSLMTVLIPFSIGLFIVYKDESIMKKIYRIMLLVIMIITLIGMIYTFYLTIL